MGLWSKKLLSEFTLDKQIQGKGFNRALTTFDLIMLGIGCVIGAGLFSITGIAAAQNAGPAIAISFVLAAFGCLFAGLSYCELAAMIPISGSAYSYAYASLGELVAWIIGWDLILEYAIGASAVAISWSAYAVSFAKDLGILIPECFSASPWQIFSLSGDRFCYGAANIPAACIVIAISLLLMRGIKQSSIVNTVFVMIKVTIALIFICVGAFYVNVENYSPFIPENTGVFGEFGLSGILRASGVLFFAYIGFDSVSTTAFEAKNPQKSVPRGILGSLFICTIIYILFSIVLTGLVNYKELGVAAPVALAISKTPYPWLQWLIKLAVLAGLTSVMLVLLLGQSRIFYAMASDGLLPKRFTQLHKEFKTPWVCNIVLLIGVSLIAAFVPITVISHTTSIGTLFAFVVVCAGVIILRVRHPDHPRTFKVPLFPYIPLLGIATCLLMMFSLDIMTWVRLFIWLAIGLVIYIAYGRKHSIKNVGQ